jgi:hypothetical protein
MVSGSSRFFQFPALVCAVRTRHTCRVFAWFSKHVHACSTSGGKICAQFSRQFPLFYKGKVKEKENRVDANGEFVNGCLK